MMMDVSIDEDLEAQMITPELVGEQEFITLTINI